MHLGFWRCACSLLLGFLAVGCGGDDAKEPSTADANSIRITDANQYTSTSSLDIPVVDTAATDLNISWSTLDKDLLCHDVELPSGIRNLTLLRFQETRAEVAKRLAGDPISASELYDVYYGHKTLGKTTSAMLSDFATLTGSKTLDVDEAYVEGDVTYLLIALSSESLGVGARSMTFLNPTADSLVADVKIEPGCGILSFQAKLQDALSVPKAGPWLIDWSGLEVDGQGHPTSFAGVDQLLVGFYPGRDQQSIKKRSSTSSRTPRRSTSCR